MAKQEEATVQSSAAGYGGGREDASAPEPGANASANQDTRNDHRDLAAADGIRERSERVREDAGLLLQHAGEAVALLAALARDRLERHPYTTLLTAAGIGYVLGGGLPKRFVNLAIGVGLRQVGGEVLTRLLANGQGAEPPQHARSDAA